MDGEINGVVCGVCVSGFGMVGGVDGVVCVVRAGGVVRVVHFIRFVRVGGAFVLMGSVGVNIG